MNTKFKIGDIIQMDKDAIYKRYSTIPTWYNSEYYTITKFTGENDSDGFPIIEVDKIINDWTSRITTEFIKHCIKKQRNLKLQKLYESR